MEFLTRTVYADYLQDCLLLQRPFQMFNNTTLNQKYGILESISPGSGTWPSLQYFAVGNGGHRAEAVTSSANQTVWTNVPVQHRARDAALFSGLPFVLRRTDNDLTAAERPRFALRRQEEHDGVQYYAYYLRRIVMTDVAPVMELRVIANGAVVSSQAFVPTQNDLNPTVPAQPGTGVLPTDGDYVAAAARLTLPFTEWDMEELRNVGRVLYDNEAAAIVSEIALCSGQDRVVTITTSGGGTVNFNEAIAVQCNGFIPAMISAAFNNVGNTVRLDVGNAEPLFIIS